MMKISEEKMAAYRLTARKRWLQEGQQLNQRKEEAWVVAKQAAVLLKNEFGITQVILYGSLVNDDFFHARSDVDLAVRGLDEKLYYRAVARLLFLSSTIEVDLARIEEVSDTLRITIEKEGIAIDENTLYNPGRADRYGPDRPGTGHRPGRDVDGSGQAHK